MLKALFYCHQVVNVVHRDIKPDNIMINQNNQAVLIDFGVSLITQPSSHCDIKTTEGSYIYFAPELLFKKEEKEKIQIKGEKTDIWALGISFY